MNVLSVDWDYFFPNSGNYDWGHGETNQFMMEAVWSHRVASRNMRKPEIIAVNEMRPKGYENFWDKIQFSDEPLLIVAETHKDMHMALDQYVRADTVFNFDAHNDIAYRDGDRKSLHCGSWVHHAFKDKLLKRYELIYPEWRKTQPEAHDIFAYTSKKIKDNTKVHYAMPELPKIGAVFICRSSSWSPSWSDDNWLEFIYWWQNNKPFSWGTKACAEWVLKKRSPNLIEAEKMAEIIVEAQNSAKENVADAPKIILQGFMEAQKILGFKETPNGAV